MYTHSRLTNLIFMGGEIAAIFEWELSKSFWIALVCNRFSIGIQNVIKRLKQNLYSEYPAFYEQQFSLLKAFNG